MIGNVFVLYPVKVEYLAARQDGGDHLVFFRSGEYENSVGRGLFQRLQEGIESLVGEHVNLVDDVHLVFSKLGRVAHLIDQIADVVHRVVGGGVEFVDVQGVGVFRSALLETVDHAGYDTRTGGFSHSPWPAKQHGLRQLLTFNGVLERCGDVLLTHHLFKPLRSVLSRRYYKAAHDCKEKKLFRKMGMEFYEIIFLMDLDEGPKVAEAPNLVEV